MAYLDPQVVSMALALALGMLIGMQRERVDARLGLRTLTLLSGAGGASVLLAGRFGNLVVVATLLAAALLLAMVLRRDDPGKGRQGATTAIAALVTFLVGVMAGAGMWLQSVFLAAATMLLLHWKQPLHHWINRIGPREFEAIAWFTLIALLVLPVLPDRTFGPYDVFNPFRSWLFVVLIVGINITGYLLSRFSSRSSGLWLAGVVGGMISSTATAASYASASRRQNDFGAAAALVILVASAVVYARVLIELFLVSPELLPHAAGPMVVLAIFLVALALPLSRRAGRREMTLPEQKNPARLNLALAVAAVYVIILFAVAITRDLLGDRALYVVATVSGLTDVDALTLSVAQYHTDGKLSADTAWRAIFLATLANLAFKTCLAAVLGARDLMAAILVTGSAGVLSGVLLLWIWP